MRTAVCPGTFDPITNGHLDIILRAASMFDEVIVGVAEENYKNTLFSLQERVELIQSVTTSLKHFRVMGFSGLLMNFVREQKACAIVRGLRAVSDFEYEFQLSMMNKKLAPDVETMFLMTDSENSFLSSSIIKQVAGLGGAITGLVPKVVEQALNRKLVEQALKRN